MKKKNNIHQNWKKFLKEEKIVDPERTVLDEMIEESLNKCRQPLMLNELEAVMDKEGIKLKTNFAKWAAIAGISTQVTGVATLAIWTYAPPTAWIGMMIPSVLAAMGSPIVLGAMGFLILRFKWTRNLALKIFKWIGGASVEKIIETGELVIDKMIEASQGKLSKENAWELFKLVGIDIINNSEFRAKMKELHKAQKERKDEQLESIMGDLERISKDIIKEDILEGSDEDEEALEDEAEIENEIERNLPEKEEEGEMEKELKERYVIGDKTSELAMKYKISPIELEQIKLDIKKIAEEEIGGSFNDEQKKEFIESAVKSALWWLSLLRKGSPLPTSTPKMIEFSIGQKVAEKRYEKDPIGALDRTGKEPTKDLAGRPKKIKQDMGDLMENWRRFKKGRL